MPHVLPHLMQHCQHGNVGLAGASGGADQHVLVAVERCGVDAALNAVQCPAGSTEEQFRMPYMAQYLGRSMLVSSVNICSYSI